LGGGGKKEGQGQEKRGVKDQKDIRPLASKRGEICDGGGSVGTLTKNKGWSKGLGVSGLENLCNRKKKKHY